MDKRGRVLVSELGREDIIRVVEASLRLPALMGPVEEEAVAQQDDKTAMKMQALKDYGKLVEDLELADVVLVNGCCACPPPRSRPPRHIVLTAPSIVTSRIAWLPWSATTRSTLAAAPGRPGG